MIIHHFNEWYCDIGKSMEVKLPRKGLKLDPRANFPHWARFDIDYHDDGITATLTRVNDVDDWDDNFYYDDEFTMRLYDPQIETVPDFTSTIYMYMGLRGERAPIDTTVVIIHPSVKIIQKFECCKKLRRVIMNENVETIGPCAFINCHSLDAVFLPSSIKEIGDWAFVNCPDLRILSVPQAIDIDKIGGKIIDECDTLFRIIQLPPYEENGRSIINNDQVHHALIGFNHNRPPLHKVCLNTNVTAQSIRQCIDTHSIATAYNTNYGLDRMTPMHILALNPHADTGAFLTLFHANMGAIFEPYSEGDSHISGKTPLECLGEYDVDSYLSVIAALCKHREALAEESMRNKRQKLN